MTLAVALAHGETCQDCKGTCDDEPTEQSPLRLKGHDCETCDGSGKKDGECCKDCQGSGLLTLTSCPRKLVTSESRYVIRAADAFRHHVLLVGGGYLDQPDAAMQAIQHVIACEAPYRARAGSRE